MRTDWVETNNVVQHKRGIQKESRTEGQEMREPRVVPTARGRRLDPAYLKRLMAQHREALEALAENDGPVLQAQDTTPR